MNYIFEKLLTSKACRFVADFTYNSKELFVDQGEKEVIDETKKEDIYHPGEFGTYREEIVKSFLKSILPQKFGIGSGFIITKKGNVSTQCDIIIYDSQNCPVIESPAKQTFFPIECVVAVGEIKSDIRCFKDLKKILKKLHAVKKWRDDVDSDTELIYRRKYAPSIVDMQHCPEDSIVTFLICNKIETRNIKDALVNVYDSNIEQRLKHNFILSLNDGFYAHCYNNQICCYPMFEGNTCDDIFLPKNSKDDYSYIITFLNYLYIALSNNSIFRLSLADYLSNQEISYYLCGKEDDNS